MKNRIRMILLVGLILIVSGCSAQKDAEITTVKINKDGTLENYIAEKFEKEYYDQAELQDMIESDISDFNLTEGTEKIKLKEIVVEEGIARPVIVFANPESYADFNDVVFFFGTVAQAYENGFDLDISLTSVKDESVIGKDDILGMGDRMIVITEENICVEAYHNIEYKSNNISIDGNKEAVVAIEEGELAYIIFK